MQSITQVVIPAVRQTVDANTPLPAVVDVLMDVQTAIATLEVLEKNLKAQLVASGQTEICGMNGRAVVSTVQKNAPIDWHAIVNFLQPSEAVIERFTGKTPKAGVKVCVFGYN